MSQKIAVSCTIEIVIIEDKYESRFMMREANILYWQKTILLFFLVKQWSGAVWARRKEDVHPQADRAKLRFHTEFMQMDR